MSRSLKSIYKNYLLDFFPSQHHTLWSKRLGHIPSFSENPLHSGRLLKAVPDAQSDQTYLVILRALKL